MTQSKSMKYIIIDSREKPKAIQRTLEYFRDHGIEYEVSKLLFGDYMDFNRPQIVVDRKQNIAELAKNCTIESERFRREMERAAKAGAELVILVEQNTYKDRGKTVEVNSIEDLLLWSSPHTMIKGEKVYRVLVSWTAKFPIRVEFCDNHSTGQRIVEILYGGENKSNQG